MYHVIDEGIYLHSRIATNVFDSPAPFKIYYVIGWVFPLVCVLSWAIIMAVKSISISQCHEVVNELDCTTSNNRTCWEGYTEEPSAYILSVPMTMALAINLLFLINIVRVLLSKLRSEVGAVSFSSNSQSNEMGHVFKALRATMILFPLLGITNLLFFMNPKTAGTLDKIYMLFNASMQSSQGIFLAILYCFLNSEVQETIRRYFERITTGIDIRRRAAAAAAHQAQAVNNTSNMCNIQLGQLQYSSVVRNNDVRFDRRSASLPAVGKKVTLVLEGERCLQSVLEKDQHNEDSDNEELATTVSTAVHTKVENDPKSNKEREEL